MRVLVVHAHPDPKSFNRALCDAAVKVLRSNGHDVHIIDLYAEQFVAAMTRAERVAYETDSPIQCDQVRKHAELVKGADAFVFVYPTWWFGMPAVMKGWLERGLVWTQLPTP
jgi:NAD(P)H dehydrogenase (quinone)